MYTYIYTHVCDIYQPSTKKSQKGILWANISFSWLGISSFVGKTQNACNFFLTIDFLMMANGKKKSKN